MVSESSFFYYSKFECFNSNYIIVECFKIFKFVWIRLLVADAIKMATKRKHHEVTLKVKYEALKELEKGRPNKDVANQFSIPGSILATWKKKSLKLFKIHHWNDKEWKLEHEALLMWFASMRGNNNPIIGPILLEKAHEFAKAFN